MADHETFATALPVAGPTGAFAGDTSTAVIERDTPETWNGWQPSPAQWISWTAPTTERYLFWMMPDFAPVIDVYTGDSLHTLVPLEEQAASYPTTGREPAGYEWFAIAVVIPAVAGVTYHVRAQGERPDDVGPFILRWQQVDAHWSAWHPQAEKFARVATRQFWYRWTLRGEAHMPAGDFTDSQALSEGALHQHDQAPTFHGADWQYARWHGGVDGGTSTANSYAPNYLDENLQVVLGASRSYESEVWVGSFDLTTWRNAIPLHVELGPGEGDGPVFGEEVRWETDPIVTTELLPGGQIEVAGTVPSIFGPNAGQLRGRFDLAVKTPVTPKIFPVPENPLNYVRNPADGNWVSSLDSLVAGDPLGEVGTTGDVVSPLPPQPARLAENILTEEDGKQYLNVAIRDTSSIYGDQYPGVEQRWDRETRLNVIPDLRVLLPRYATYDYLLTEPLVIELVISSIVGDGEREDRQFT